MLAGPAAAAAPSGAGLRTDVSGGRLAPPAGGSFVADLSSARTQTWSRRDGGYVTRLFERPVNIRDAKGNWAAIDPSLSQQGDGTFINGTAGFGLRLPATAGGPVKVADGDRWISLSLQGGGGGAPKVTGATATYAGAGVGVDARLTSTDAGVKEDLILASGKSQSSFTYDVSLSAGLSLRSREGGSIDVVDAKDAVVFTLPEPVAADAAGAGAGEQATMTTDGKTVTVELSKAWLADPDRKFPVTLDPTTNVGPTTSCYISTGLSNCSSGAVLVGNSSGVNYRALFQFNIAAAAIPKSAFIQHANLSLYAQSVDNPGVSNPMTARQITSPWDGSATWIKRTASANWATAGGDVSSSSLGIADVPAVGTRSAFAMTMLLRAWLNGSTPNTGVALTSSTGDNLVQYGSGTNANTNQRAYLDVEWFDRTGNLPSYTIDSQDPISDRQSLGVNVVSGNLLLSAQDLQVAAKGFPVSVGRFYNSGDSWGNQVDQAAPGKGGWSLSVGRDFTLYNCDDTTEAKCLKGPSGWRARFAPLGSGAYQTPPQIGNWTLKRAGASSGAWTLTDNTSGTKYNFFDAPNSWVDSITDRQGNTETFAYNGPGGALSAITDTNGRTYAVTPVASGNGAGQIASISVASSQFAGGVTWTYAYDSDNRLWKATDAEGKVTTYVYGTTAGANDYGLLKKITDARTHDTLITYDSDHRVASVTRVIDGTTTNDITTTYAYTTTLGSSCTTPATPAGTLGQTAVTDPLGHATNYCWNSDGLVTRARNAKGQDTATTFTPEGNVGTVSSNPGGTGSANAVTTYGYGGGGTSNYNLTSTSSPVAAANGSNPATFATTSSKYKPASDSTSDAQRQFRLDEVTDEQGKVTRYDYNAAGDVTNIKNTGGNTAPGTSNAQFSWWTVSNSSGAAKGELEWSQVGGVAGSQTHYYYDTLGRLTTIDPPGNLIGNTTYTYDGLSRVATMTDGRGKVTTYGYDKVGRQTTVTDNASVTQTFGYDANGNLTSRTEPGKSSSYAFDFLNRPTSQSVPGDSSSYTWDKASNLKTMTDYTGTSTYGYDEINRTTSITAPAVSGPDATPTTYDYVDPLNGNPGSITQTLPGSGGTIKTTQDLSGKTTEVLVKDNGGTQTMKRTYAYVTAATGSQQHELLDTATEQAGPTGPVVNKSYLYDDSGQLTDAATLDAAMNITADDQFTYDGAGNRTKRVRLSGGTTTTRTYAYNAVNELCWRTDATVTGTPTCASVPTGATQYTYDASGNQLTGDTALTYDDKGRLATLAGANITNLATGNTDVSAIGTTSYRNTLLGTTWINAAGNISKIQRTTSGGAISQVRDGAKHWLVQDQIGSTIALITATGTVAQFYGYDADGNDTPSAPTGPKTWIRYAGGVDVGNGLYHYANRYYQPTTARWTQQDPVTQPGDLQQVNRYTYAGSSPVNYTDASGLYVVTGPQCDFTASRNSSSCKGYKQVRGACVKGAAEGFVRGGPPGAVSGCGTGATQKALGVPSPKDILLYPFKKAYNFLYCGNNPGEC